MPKIPPYNELLWPALLAVRELGHTATIEEVVEKVIERQDFTEDQLAVLHKDGPRSEIEYRLAWARTYLKGMGQLDNPKRGIWVTTEAGKTLTEDQVEPLRQQYVVDLRDARKMKEQAAGAAGADDDATVADDETSDWREQLLTVLLAMPPDAFEHLAKRLLRAAGFINTNVTGKSGDGGIDGVGVYRLSLVSFPVFFQCKRYKGSVTPDKVRDFRGAMAGENDGLNWPHCDGLNWPHLVRLSADDLALIECGSGAGREWDPEWNSSSRSGVTVTGRACRSGRWPSGMESIVGRCGRRFCRRSRRPSGRRVRGRLRSSAATGS